MKEYNTSFACFCDINKEQYENIYINNKYIPIIDNFGDIKINIKSIIKILNEYRNDKRIIKKPEKQKFKKKFIMNKRNRENLNNFKFPFKIRLKKFNKKIKIPKENNNNNNLNIKPIINNNNINNINNNIPRNHLPFNLKDKGKGLSICIPKERSNIINNNRPLLNLGNSKTFQNLKMTNKPFSLQMGNILNKNIISNIPNINPATINSVLSNSGRPPSSDIFNFSNRDIRYYLNNPTNLINNLSPNIPLLTPIISPFPISPYHNLFSAHLSNNILQDGTNFNNTIINPNPFIFPTNSPALINININNNINLNNNIVNNGNNFNNNMSAGQNNSIKNNNMSNISNNS